MSLFSRLDRVRTGREAKDRDEGGLFGVPDLGAPTNQAAENQASDTNSDPSQPVTLPSFGKGMPQAFTPADASLPETPEIHNPESQENAEEFRNETVFGAASLPAVSSQSESESELSQQETASEVGNYKMPTQPDEEEDLARLALGETALPDPKLESPFMTAIMSPTTTSSDERLPIPKGPFRSPAMFKTEKKQEVQNTTVESEETQEKVVAEDSSQTVSAVDLPSMATPDHSNLPASPETNISKPEAVADVSDLPSVQRSESILPTPTPAAPQPAPAPPKSPFDRLMAERVPVAPVTPTVPASPAAPPDIKPRPSLLDRLNARTASLEQEQAASKQETPASVPKAPEPVIADEPLDRDAEIPAEFMPQSAVDPVTEPASVELPLPEIPPIATDSVAEIPSTSKTEPTPISPPRSVTPLAVSSGVPTTQPTPVVETSAPNPESPVALSPVAGRLFNRRAISENPSELPKLENRIVDTPLEEASAEDTPVESITVAPKTSEPSLPSSIVTGNRGFADRLAARESLDRDINVVVPEASPRLTGAELVRIDEEANLSERERKVRILYRQKHLIFDSVLGSLDPRLMQNPTRETLRPPLEKSVDNALREFNLIFDSSERSWMIDEFLRETTDVGPLVPLLDDPGISKIIVTGANDVSVEKLGRIERVGISFRDDDHLLALVRRIAEMTGGRIDAKVPLLDRPLPDGARIRAKVPPIAPQPTLTIEKSTGNPFIALKRSMNERTRGETLPYNQLRERIQVRLLREFEGNTAATANQEKLRVQVEEMISQVILEEKVAVTRAEKAALVMDLLNEIVGLGPLEPLLNDPDVDEVMVNGPYQIYVERKGKLELSNQRFRDNAHAMQVIERIIAPLGRRIDEKSPMVDGRLRDGSRFNAIIPPLALGGPTMTIRKFARDPFTMTDLINFGSLTREAAQFLHAAVEGKLNVLVSGGTGSGKTTTLNVLSSFIPSTDRIVTIEDAAELQLRQEHVIRLETRPANIEGVGEITIRDLVRNALRMRPDRIVVGECRGGEALDMLQAMNTGHDGSLTTAHSNGPRDTLKRLETMVMMAGFDLPVKAIREQIAMAVHLIVHQERMRDGKRRITAITEIVGMEGDVITLQDLFRFEQERIDDEGRIHGALVPTGLRPKNWDVIVDNGVELSMELFQRVEPNSGVRSRLTDHRTGTR
jgi:pilus assembly protein CpaF